jgi:hypothetical protein
MFDEEQIPPHGEFMAFYSDEAVYSDLAWLTAHNAFSSKEEGWMVYYQQNHDLNHMFDNGVRSFMLDVYEYEEDLHLCHGGCEVTIAQKLGMPGKFSDWLERLKAILDSNRDDIVTLHLECYTTALKVYDTLKELDLVKYLLKTKSPNDDGLTLGEMRKNDERLVIFSDYAEDRKHDKLDLVDGIYTTKYYIETEYSLEKYSACELRTDFRAEPSDGMKLFTFNHFYSVSTAKDYNEVNDYRKIMERVSTCLKQGYFPNFVTFDFYEQGDCKPCLSTKNVVNTLNSIRDALPIKESPGYTANKVEQGYSMLQTTLGHSVKYVLDAKAFYVSVAFLVGFCTGRYLFPKIPMSTTREHID